MIMPKDKNLFHWAKIMTVIINCQNYDTVVYTYFGNQLFLYTYKQQINKNETIEKTKFNNAMSKNQLRDPIDKEILKHTHTHTQTK